MIEKVKIVYHTNSDALARVINESIEEGWQPLGSIQAYGSNILQMMVKYEKTQSYQVVEKRPTKADFDKFYFKGTKTG